MVSVLAGANRLDFPLQNSLETSKLHMPTVCLHCSWVCPLTFPKGTNSKMPYFQVAPAHLAASFETYPDKFLQKWGRARIQFLGTQFLGHTRIYKFWTRLKLAAITWAPVVGVGVTWGRSEGPLCFDSGCVNMCLIQMVFVLINSRCELQALHIPGLLRVKQPIPHWSSPSCYGPKLLTNLDACKSWKQQQPCLKIAHPIPSIANIENVPHVPKISQCKPIAFSISSSSMVFPRTKTGEKPRLHYQCVLGEHLLNHLKGSWKKGSQKTWSFVT